MAHVLDRLIMHDWGNRTLRFREFLDLLPRAEMILADNVYRYFLELSPIVDHSGDGLTIDLNFKTHLPNSAPPFPIFFVGTDSYGQFDVRAAGTLFVAREVMDTQPQFFVDGYLANSNEKSRVELRRLGVRWIVYAMPFVFMQSWNLPVICMIFGIFEDGHIHNMGWMYDEAMIGALAAKNKDNPVRLMDDFRNISIMATWPALLAVNFMHCRNVEVIEHLPNHRQSKKRERKRGHPLIKFKTLRIEPIKKVLHEEGQIESNGLGVALHICRGHFKDYREGKGLFGKHKEVYWWDMQSRGSADLGTILKDYSAPVVPVERTGL